MSCVVPAIHSSAVRDSASVCCQLTPKGIFLSTQTLQLKQGICAGKGLLVSAKFGSIPSRSLVGMKKSIPHIDKFSCRARIPSEYVHWPIISR